jgi:hypothetical protein
MGDSKDFEEYDISFDDFHFNVSNLLRKSLGKMDGFEKEFNVWNLRLGVLRELKSFCRI